MVAVPITLTSPQNLVHWIYILISVAEPEPPGAATFRAAPELEPIFVVVRSWEPEPNF